MTRALLFGGLSPHIGGLLFTCWYSRYDEGVTQRVAARTSRGSDGCVARTEREAYSARIGEKEPPPVTEERKTVRYDAFPARMRDKSWGVRASLLDSGVVPKIGEEIPCRVTTRDEKRWYGTYRVVWVNEDERVLIAAPLRAKKKSDERGEGDQ